MKRCVSSSSPPLLSTHHCFTTVLTLCLSLSHSLYRSCGFQEAKRTKEEEKRRKEAEKEAEEEAKKDPERMERVKAKVAEIKASIDRKNKARQRFNNHVVSQHHSDGGKKTGIKPTDYTAWDLWTPSDEEDDMVRDLTPQGPEFKAMEKDIEERHRRMVHQRRLAERMRVEGNEALKRGDLASACQSYEIGLANEKTNMALHGNLALALMKRKCYIQAIEHCDRVLSLADFMHENAPHTRPAVVKALQRRATARRELGHLREAAEDLTRALEMMPEDKEILDQIARVELEQKEERAAKSLAKEAAKPEDHQQPSNNVLRQVEEAVRSLNSAKTSMARASAVAAAAVAVAEGTTNTEGENAATPPVAPFDPLSQKPKGRKGNTTTTSSQDKVQVKMSTPSAKHLEAIKTAQKACEDLAMVLKRDEGSRTHLRTCGGLQALGDLIQFVNKEYTSTSAAQNGGGSGGGGGAHNPVVQLVPLEAATLDALEAACHNDFNGEWLVQQTVLQDIASISLPRLLQVEGDKTNNDGALTTRTRTCTAAAVAALKLLVTCSTAATARKALCGGLVADDAQGLRSLVAFLTTSPSSTGGAKSSPKTTTTTTTTPVDTAAALGLALLSQASVDRRLQAAFKHESYGLAKALGSLLASSLAKKAGEEDKGQVSAVWWQRWEHAAGLVGNLCVDPVLRASLSGIREVIVSLAALTQIGLGQLTQIEESTSLPSSVIPPPALISRRDQERALGNGLSSLCNLSLEAQTVSAMEGQTGLIKALTSALVSPPSNVVRARCALLLSRLVKAPGVLAIAVQHGLWTAVGQLIAGTATGTGNAQGGVDEDEDTIWGGIEAGVRMVAIGASGGPAERSALVPTGVIEALAAVILGLINDLPRGGGAKYGHVLGNGSLALGELAGVPGAKEVFLKSDAVEALVEVMKKQSGGVQKNAAIACAKVAMDPQLKEELQKHRGIEIMMQIARA